MDANTTVSEIPVKKPLCLMLGNEQSGLSEKARAACDLLYSIPMTGMSESLNLSVSAGISLYDTTQRKRQQLQHTGDLPAAEYQRLKACYYLNSVYQRLVDHLFFQHT